MGSIRHLLANRKILLTITIPVFSISPLKKALCLRSLTEQNCGGNLCSALRSEANLALPVSDATNQAGPRNDTAAAGSALGMGCIYASVGLYRSEVSARCQRQAAQHERRQQKPTPMYEVLHDPPGRERG